jgi:hypothetical protein
MEGIEKINTQDLFEKAYATEMFTFLMKRDGAVSEVYRSSIMANLWKLKDSEQISEEFYFKIFKKYENGK